MSDNPLLLLIDACTCITVDPSLHSILSAFVSLYTMYIVGFLLLLPSFAVRETSEPTWTFTKSWYYHGRKWEMDSNTHTHSFVFASVLIFCWANCPYVLIFRILCLWLLHTAFYLPSTLLSVVCQCIYGVPLSLSLSWFVTLFVHRFLRLLLTIFFSLSLSLPSLYGSRLLFVISFTHIVLCLVSFSLSRVLWCIK
jgi:hypothetical protein